MVRNCTRDEGGPFEAGSQVQVSSHRELLSSSRDYWSLTKMLSHPQAPSFRQPLGCIAALCRTSKRRFTNFLLE